MNLTKTRIRTTTIAPIAQPQNIEAYKKRAAFQLSDIAVPTSCAVCKFAKPATNDEYALIFIAAGTALTSRVSSACSCLHSESTTVTSTITAPAAVRTLQYTPGAMILIFSFLDSNTCLYMLERPANIHG